MGGRWLQFCTRDHGFFFVVVKQILTRLEARNDRMAARSGMLRGVLRRRAVTTADVTALRAAPQMQPPPARGQAFHATISARFRRRVDTAAVRGWIFHHTAPFGFASTLISSCPGRMSTEIENG
jgi:hypothetical protein